MSINPPPEIADFLGFVTGMEWPEADEDLMRQVAGHYAAIAKDLTTLSGYVLELIPIVKNDFEGEAADSFVTSMNDLTGRTAGENQLEKTAELALQLSEMALKVANQVEYTKIMAIMQLVELLAQIMFAMFFSPFTFGAVWGPVSVMFTMTREGIKNLFLWLLSTILSQTFIGITGGIFRDMVIQLYQLGSGHTTKWNNETMIQSIQQGALTGLVGGPLEVVFHYGGKLLGKLLGGSDPGSILSKRVDDALKKKIDDKVNDTLDNVPTNTSSNPGRDIPGNGTGPVTKNDELKPDLQPNGPVNKVPDTPTPPPTPTRTSAGPEPDPSSSVTPPVRTETPGGAVMTPGAGRPDAPASTKPIAGGAKDNSPAPQTAGTPSKASGPTGRTVDVDVPPRLESLLATKQARQNFAEDVGNLLGGVNRQLETGFLRFGEGTIASAFADKMGDVFAKHLAYEGAREAGKEFGEVLTRKWVRLGAEHGDLSEALTKALGGLADNQPLKNLADAMPNLFARSEHDGFLSRVLLQENPLQGNPLYQLGGSIGSLLHEGTHEMLSEGFYNVVFGDGTFEVSGGPFAAGVCMSLLGSGLNRMFEPVMVKYQDWVLSHQYAENHNDNKYFGLLHPINIASFVANMTGNPAPWPVPRPTSAPQDPSVVGEMKDMVKWVFSNPFTGSSFFSESTPSTPDPELPTADTLDSVLNVTTESDGGTDYGLPAVANGPSSEQEINEHSAFRRTESGATFTTADLSQMIRVEERVSATPEPSPLPNGAEHTPTVATPTTTPTPLTAVVQPTPTTSSAADADADTIPTSQDDTPPNDGAATAPKQPDTAPPGDGDETPVLVIPAGITVGDLSTAQTNALKALPPRDGVFVVGMHTGPNGPPDTATTLNALIDAHDTGKLEGITQIQFTACNLATPVNGTTIKTVMSGLWKHRATTAPDGRTTPTPDPLKGLAANAPVWYITNTDTTAGHLVTARHIGITPDGKPTILTEGAAWHEYSDNGAPDHTPTHTDTHSNDIPDGFIRTNVLTPATSTQHDDAVKFGTGPGEDGFPPSMAPPAPGPFSALEASIEDRARIRYLEESQAFERRLADYLATRDDVNAVAETMAQNIWRRVPREKRGRLGTDDAAMPGSVGTKEEQLRRVVQVGNLRERMTLIFCAISSQVLPQSLGHAIGYPKAISDERKDRHDRPEYREFRRLEAEVTGLSKARQTDSDDYKNAYEAWSELAKKLRTDRKPEEVTPPLSSAEWAKSVDRRGSLRWIPGAAKLHLPMGASLQKTSSQHGRLVMTGTSGSGFYFHQHAQLMVDQWEMTIDHQALRLALIATFVGQGHHSLPEVMAASSLFGHLSAIDGLHTPTLDRAGIPDWRHYRTIGSLSEEELRTRVAVDGKFPDERVAEYRASLTPDVEMVTTAIRHVDLTDANPLPKRRRGDDGNGDGEDTERMQTKRDRHDGSPSVPEHSPVSQPGQKEPVQVTPTDQPVAPERWSEWKWTPGRQDVPPPAHIRNERFDPAADPTDTGPYAGTADRRRGGLLEGRATRINADVQRFNVPEGDGLPGGAVRLVQLTLPVATDGSYSADEVAALRDRLQGLLDAHVNLGFELPRTKDQLHMEVRLVPMPVAQDGISGHDWIRVSRDAGAGQDSDQLHFRLHGDDADPAVKTRDDAMLLHEVLHYAGLPDRYHDAGSLFRHTPDRADASGIMAEPALPNGAFPQPYLEAIENVTESGSVLYDNNGPGTWTSPDTPVRAIPAGITVGDLSTAQTNALKALPPRDGVFVVGMHTGPNGPPDTATTLNALINAHDTGKLEGITQIQFTACDLATPANETTVKTVMSGLWKHRATTTPDPLTALAANAPVWYIPTPDTAGHLVTARHIGITPDGKPTILTDGAAWHEYTDTGAPDHTPTHTDADTRTSDNPAPTDPQHPDAVKFGTEAVESGPLSRVLPKEFWWTMLAPPAERDGAEPVSRDEDMTELLGEVLDGQPTPGGDWRTVNPDSYLKLRARAERGGMPSQDTAEATAINDAFSSYDEVMASASDDRQRLQAIATAVQDLQWLQDAELQITADVRILAQRLLLDQGYTPSLLPADGYTTSFWKAPPGGSLAYHLALGMATFARLTSRLPQGSAAEGGPLSRVLPKESWPALLASPDQRRSTHPIRLDDHIIKLLGEVLDGDHTPDSDWHTLNADSYLRLRARVEGNETPSQPDADLRTKLDAIFDKYRRDVADASGDGERVNAIANMLKELHKVKELGPSSETGITANVRILAQRLLLDQGYTPSLLPANGYTANFWVRRPNSQIAEELAIGMATFARFRSQPSEQTPDATTVSDDQPDGTLTVTALGTDPLPDGGIAPHGANAGDDGEQPADADAGEEAADWRSVLAGLGSRTDEMTTAYLVSPKAPHQLAGLSDALLRTDDKPYATLTKERPTAGGQTLLEVTIPAGHAVDTGEGRLLVGKDDLTEVTVTGVFTYGSPLHPWQRRTEAVLVNEPLSVLTRMGQALHVYPGGTDVDNLLVRVALRIAYADASRQIERPLGQFLGELESVQRQVSELVQAIWNRLDDSRRVELGTQAVTGSGSVGNDLAVLEHVVQHGNIREQMHMLATAVHGPALKGVLTLQKNRPPILDRDWKGQQQQTQLLQHVEKLRAELTTISDVGERAASAAELDRLMQTDLRPDDVVPPLSAAERRHVVRDGRLGWVPGEHHRQIRIGAESQAIAEATGGLMSAGTSNTTYFTMAAVHTMSQKWGLQVDYQLLRLALLADMLPVGHHSFYEVMTAAEAFGRNVLGNSTLDYSDDWGRFRTLAPLDEATLRGAMPGRRFPDEVAFGLEPGEAVPDAWAPLWEAHVTEGPGPLSEVLPEDSWWMLLADPDERERLSRRDRHEPGSRPDLRCGPDFRDRVTELIREVLDDKRGPRHDWRRLHADSYRELRRRIEGTEQRSEPQRGVRDEVQTVLERIHTGENVLSWEVDGVRVDLDKIFDEYYGAVEKPSATREHRLVAIADVVQKLQQVEGLGSSSDTGITADVRIVAQRFLLDQGFTPALLPPDGYTPPFWQRSTDQIADDLAEGMETFARLTTVRAIPAGIAVGILTPGRTRALNMLLPRPGVFVVGMHTGPNGPPDTATTLNALIDAHDTGRLDGITQIQFTACDLATPANETTVKTVMSGLWKHRATSAPDGRPIPNPDTLTALAANAPVWYIPTSTDTPDATAGHLVTARHIGITPDGRPTILTDGAAWHEYTDTGDSDHTPTHTSTHSNDIPDGPTPTTHTDPQHPDAVTFGTEPEEAAASLGDGGDADSVSISVSMDGEPFRTHELTVSFKKGAKTIDPADGTHLYKFAKDLIPELTRRYRNQEDKLQVSVHAGGNHWFGPAAEKTGTERAHSIVEALKFSITSAADAQNVSPAARMVDFVISSRGRAIDSADTATEESPSELRRRTTISTQLRVPDLRAEYDPYAKEAVTLLRQLVNSNVQVTDLALAIGHARGNKTLLDEAGQEGHPTATAVKNGQQALPRYQQPVRRSALLNLTEVKALQQLADNRGTDHTALPLHQLVGAKTGWKAETQHKSAPNHNVIYEVLPLTARNAGQILGEGRVVFAPDARFEVVSVERVESGRTQVTLREVSTRALVGSGQGPSRTPQQETPAIGIPGVSYPGPNRPLDSTLVYDRNKKQYVFRGPNFIHRGEVEVELVDGKPFVRFYTAVANGVQLTVDPEVPGRATSDGYKDIQQDPATGRVVLGTGGQRDGVMWTGVGTPGRAIAWAMKYKAESQAAAGKAETPVPVNKPLIRSYLVPMDVYREITSTAIPEVDAKAPGHAFRGDESHVTVPEPHPGYDSGLHDEQYLLRLAARTPGSAPQPFTDGPAPNARRTINTDQPGERNQFGIRGEHLGKLREKILPHSLITYHEGPDALDADALEAPFSKHGRVVHVNELRRRLDIPDVEDRQLLPAYNPWLDGARHRNDAGALQKISAQLRQHYVTWLHFQQQPAERMPNLLLDETSGSSYDRRLNNLKAFLQDHSNAFRKNTDLAPELRNLDDDIENPRHDKASVDRFMTETVLPWASHAEIAYVLSRQAAEALADRNLTDAPVMHDFSEMRRHVDEDVQLQIRAGKKITELWQNGNPTYRMIDRLMRDYPELAHRYSQICAETERYTFFEHAQMVVGQYLKLAALDADDPDRVVPVDAIVKAILFHDIEKMNSKAMYGKGKDAHDAEPEHRGAVELMGRYRYLWGETEAEMRAFKAAVMMVDSDPFGFYYRRKHSKNAADNRDTAFQWLAEAALKLHGRPVLRHDGTQRRLAELTQDDTGAIARLFHEFHQYYQADFSSYTVYSRYVSHNERVSQSREQLLAQLTAVATEAVVPPQDDDTASVTSERSDGSWRTEDSEESRTTSTGERRPGDDAIEEQAHIGMKTFNASFIPPDDQESPNTTYPLRDGPRLAVDESGRPVHPLRFAFAPQYERMYGDLAAMFATPDSIRAHFQRIGEARLHVLSGVLGDPRGDKGKAKAPQEVAQSHDDEDFTGLDFDLDLDLDNLDLAEFPVAPNADGSPSTPLSDTDSYFPGDIFGDDSTSESGLRDLDDATPFGNDGVTAAVPTTSGDAGDASDAGDRVHEIADAITRSRQDNDTHFLIDPRTDPVEADKLRNTIGRFPRDERFFTLASHIVGTDGALTWRGRRVSPAELAAVLSRLADNGVWDTSRPLQFAACDLGRGLNESYAANTLRELRMLLPELPLHAYAPQAALWFVPRVTGPFTADTTGPGYTVAAHKVGWDANGTPRLQPDHWVRLSLDVGEHALVEYTVLNADTPPDGYLTLDPPGTSPLPGVVPSGRIEPVTERGDSSTGTNGEGGSSQPGPNPSEPDPGEPSTPPAAATRDEPTPQVPWHVADGALGDGYVTSVHTWADADRKAWLASTESALGRDLDAKTAKKVMEWVRPRVTSQDPADWQGFLRNGVTFRADGKLMTLTAWPENLRHHQPQPKDDLAGFASRTQPATNRTVTSGGNTQVSASVDTVVRLLDAGALAGVIPTVRVQAGTTTASSRATSVDTQGVGRTVIDEMHEFDGDVCVTLRVQDGTPLTFDVPNRLRIAFPEGSVPADGVPSAGPRPVVNPNGLKAVLSTVNAVAPKQIVAELAGHLAAADVASDVAAAFLNEVTGDLLNEKMLKDSNQWWTSGSWTSKVFVAAGRPGRSLAGHFQVSARLTTLERKGDTGGELRVREDFADSFGVKSSSKHGGKAAVNVSTSALFSLNRFVVVPSVDLAVNTARAHNFDAGGSDKSKQKLKFAGEKQADYRAEADFRVEFRSLSKNPIPPFESRLVLAVGVPASQVARFEALTLGTDLADPADPGDPAATAVEDPEPAAAGAGAAPAPGTPAPTPLSRFGAATHAIRTVLRLARQEPASHFDVGVHRPFPTGGMPSTEGLLKIAKRQPIEVAVPSGNVPTGPVWDRLTAHPNVSIVDDRDSYSVVPAAAPTSAPGPVFRYYADGQGLITDAQRLGTTSFTGLFGPLSKAHTGGLTELTAFLEAHPRIALLVLVDAQFTTDDTDVAADLQTLRGHRQVSPQSRFGVHRTLLVANIAEDGTIELPDTLRHPVEQAKRNLAAAAVLAAQPVPPRADTPPLRHENGGIEELTDLAADQGPVQLQISPDYPAAQQVRTALGNDGPVRLLNALGTPEQPVQPEGAPRQEPPKFLMVVDGQGRLLGPFPRREFPVNRLEPLSLASRKGLGPGMVGELPGSEQVLPAARTWLDARLAAAGLKKQLSEQEYGHFQRELAAALGTPGMRARFTKLMGSGVPVTLKAGDHEIRLHLRTELKELRGTSEESDLTLGRSAARTANYGVGQSDQLAFSVSGGSTLRISTGGGFRVEAPAVKLTGGATISSAKESLTSTVKSSHGEESTGTHTAFTYAAVHHLTATIHDGDGKLVSGTSLEFGGDDVSAVVRVNNDHRPTADHDPAKLVTVGTTTVFEGPHEPGWCGDGADQTAEFVLPGSGLGGIHPEFLGTRELSAAAAAFLAERGDGIPPTEADVAFGRHSGDKVGALRRDLTPEIEEIFTSNFLRSEFEQLTGPDGAVFPLPPNSDGHPQALVVRLRLALAAHETSGTETSLSHSTETGTKSSVADTSSRTIGGSLGGGVHAGLTSSILAASGTVEGTRTFTDVATQVSAGTVSSTLTYQGTSHRFRSDGHFEITHHTWPPAGRYKTVAAPATLYAKVSGGVELTVPDRQARDLSLMVPGPDLDDGADGEERSYVNADLANAVSHVEKLDADQVLPAIKQALRELKVIPDALRDTPTDLSRGIASVFSKESLRANFSNLRTTSVRQLLKLRTPGGGTRLIGIRATAQVGGARYERPRGDVIMSVSDTATTSRGSASGSSDKVGAQVGVTVKGISGAGGPRGGVKVGGGAETSVGRTVTDTTTVRDQHSLEYTGRAQEFSHPVGYQVEIFDGGEPHQLARLAGAALTAPVELIDWATDGRAGRWFTERWGTEWDSLFPSGHEPKRQFDVPGGRVHLVVPDHLTQPGSGTHAPPAAVAGSIRPNGPTPVPPSVRRLTSDLAPLIQGLAMPGLDRVLPWLSAAASLPHRVAPQDTSPPKRRDLSPTTLAGLRTDLLTTEHNLRANIGALLGDGFVVPVADGKKVTVRLVVHRTRHLTSGEFESGIDTGVKEQERETERERAAVAWSGSLTPDAGGHATNGGAPISFGGEGSSSLSASQSEAVEERERRKGTQHYYEADVTWVLTGSNGTTVEVNTEGGLIGLVHASNVTTLTERHPRLFGPRTDPTDPTPTITPASDDRTVPPVPTTPPSDDPTVPATPITPPSDVPVEPPVPTTPASDVPAVPPVPTTPASDDPAEPPAPPLPTILITPAPDDPAALVSTPLGTGPADPAIGPRDAPGGGRFLTLPVNDWLA
ncbi:WXG100-like domain-containing protein [Streptomyces sp. NPDC055254]